MYLCFAVASSSLLQCCTLIIFFSMTCIFQTISTVSEDHLCYIWIHSSIVLSPCLISIFSILWSHVLGKHSAYPHETALEQLSVVFSIFLSTSFDIHALIVLVLPDFPKTVVCKMVPGVSLKKLFNVWCPWGYSSPGWSCQNVRLPHLSPSDHQPLPHPVASQDGTFPAPTATLCLDMGSADLGQPVFPFSCYRPAPVPREMPDAQGLSCPTAPCLPCFHLGRWDGPFPSWNDG